MRNFVKAAFIILAGAVVLIWAAHYHGRKVKPLPDAGGYNQNSFDRYENGDKRLRKKL